jgi:hypothetical protein
LYKKFKIFLIVIVFTGLSFPQELFYNQPRIAILYSGLSEKFDNKKSPKVIDVITSWELFLMQSEIPYKVIHDSDIETGISGDFDVLVLPSVNIISADQMKVLQSFLADGKSIISSGSKLLFENDRFNNFQNLKTLFELNNIELVSSKSISFLHSIIPNYLNHFDLEDNSVLQISTKNEILKSSNSDSNTYPYGYILPGNNIGIPESSILFGTVGMGKFVWIGFDINDLVGGKDNSISFKNLIMKSISWMDYKPEAFIENFSESISSPVITSLQYNNALKSELVDLLHNSNIRPIFLVSPNQIIPKEILQKFNDDEITLDLSISSSLKLDNLNEMINKFNTDYETNLSSILVEKNMLESSELSSINKMGIDKILYVSQSNGNPKFISNNILAVPFNKYVSANYGKTNLNFLYYEAKFNCKSDSTNELIEEINKLKATQFNFTTLNSVKKWWNVREKITLQSEFISENEIEILISNKNSVEIKNLNLFFDVKTESHKKLSTIVFNNSPIDYQIDQRTNIIEIRLVNIDPNSANKIILSFDVE